MSTPPPLLAVAHGSRDPRAQHSTRALLELVAAQLPGVDVRLSFVELARPRPDEVLAEFDRPTVVVPALLSTGYHLSTDLPRFVAEAARAGADVDGSVIAEPMGPHRLLVVVLRQRLQEAGRFSAGPVVLAAAGSTDPGGLAQVRRAAAMLADDVVGEVSIGYVSAATPGVGQAIAAARQAEGEPPFVATYLLSPGRFAEDIEAAAAQAGAGCSAPLGADPLTAQVLVQRYRAGCARLRRRYPGRYA